MQVHRSNLAEELVAQLAETVRRPVGPVTVPETICVQSLGMERWLSMEMARRFGVWAHPSFPFPRRLVEDAFSAVLGPAEPGGLAWDSKSLTWAVASVLPELVDRPEMSPLSGYLDGDVAGRRLVQLAERVGRAFDEYAVYRPELVLGWQEGAGGDSPDERWQAVLWRELVTRFRPVHLAARARDFLDRIRDDDGPLAHFPRRVSLFGIASLPPVYVRVLGALARRIDVHLFLLTPAESADAARHPLLESWGRMSADLNGVLEREVPDLTLASARWVDPGVGSFLATVQSDVLTGRRRGGRGGIPALRRRDDDESIRIHACHAPLRELEVLHDQLVELMHRDRSLQPHDVVVMAPDIEAYAPAIAAVFGEGGDARPEIPFQISDRGYRPTDETVDAFFRVTEALCGRLGASEVLDLLGLEAIRMRFGLGTDDVETVRNWTVESGIRWGEDAAHRAEHGQPALEGNTWRFGLDRLLLGFAMPVQGDQLFAGVLPWDDVEGSDAEVLGRFVDFAETAFAARPQLEGARSIGVWRDVLRDLLERMVAATETNADAHQRIRAALDRLVDRAEIAGFDAEVDLATVREQLAAELEHEPQSRGFLGGGVTFCQLVPMRCIPFRVVCIVGMNGDAFPRTRRPSGFDLVARNPRPGDRSLRDDDRHLFLEALLSARDRFLVTYVGRSIHDDAPFPASVLVSELTETVERAFGARAAEREAVRTALHLQHPLQPFSPRYFGAGDDPRLFSYAASWCVGARAVTAEGGARSPFLTGSLSLDDAAVSDVSLADLERFFRNPVRFFLQRRLSLYLGQDVEVVEDREPIYPMGLARWKLGARVLDRHLDGAELDERLQAATAATGQMPLGASGRAFWADIATDVDALARQAAPWAEGEKLPPREFILERAGMRLSGVLRDLRPHGQLEVQYSRLARGAETVLWVRHVVLSCLEPSGSPRSVIIGRAQDGKNKGVEAALYGPVSDAPRVLDRLLALYRKGLEVPLPFFRDASWAFAVAEAKGKPLDEAFAAARRKLDWTGNDLFVDEYARLVFERLDPLRDASPFPDAPEAPSFAEASRAVYASLLAHRSVERGAG